MVKSRVLQKLRSGGFVNTFAQTRITEGWYAEVIGHVGFDMIWYDLEHRPYGLHTVDSVSMACRSTGIDLMLRVLKEGYHSPMKAFEAGANGIMVPHIRSAEEARQWVEWSRYPPLGKRGLDGSGADSDWMLANTKDHILHANQETFLVFQIEDPEAVERIDEIAAVPDYDILFVGPGDLSLSYGVPLEFFHPMLEKAYDAVAQAAAKHNKHWGVVTQTPEIAQRMLDRGARMITCGSDHGHLVHGLKRTFADYSTVGIR